MVAPSNVVYRIYIMMVKAIANTRINGLEEKINKRMLTIDWPECSFPCKRKAGASNIGGSFDLLPLNHIIMREARKTQFKLENSQRYKV